MLSIILYPDPLLTKEGEGEGLVTLERTLYSCPVMKIWTPKNAPPPPPPPPPRAYISKYLDPPDLIIQHSVELYGLSRLKWTPQNWFPLERIFRKIWTPRNLFHCKI